MSGAISKSRLRAGAALLLALAAVLVFQAALAQRAQPRFPALTGRIVDEAQLLSGADKAALERELAALEQKSTDQLVIYTARSLQGYEIEDFGYQLGRAWAIGQKDKNNGVILLVAPKERKVRIEVGRGLEPQLTDALTRLIIENAILPAFRRGDFAAGIKAGVHDIRDVLLGDAEAVKERARKSAPRSSGGGFALAFLIAFILFGFIVVWALAQQTAHPSGVARDRRGRGPGSRSSDWGSGAGSWSGSGSSGSSGDGGGFSGGGGDFGGGGASGSW